MREGAEWLSKVGEETSSVCLCCSMEELISLLASIDSICLQRCIYSMCLQRVLTALCLQHVFSHCGPPRSVGGPNSTTKATSQHV